MKTFVSSCRPGDYLYPEDHWIFTLDRDSFPFVSGGFGRNLVSLTHVTVVNFPYSGSGVLFKPFFY